MMRILLPTDFSDNAHNAAVYAVQLFGLTGSIYTLLNTRFGAGYAGAIGYRPQPVSADEAEHGLARAATRLRDQCGPVQVHTKAMTDFLPDALRHFVQQHGADAVVMGRHGETGSALFGSNTVSVIGSCPVPVVVVPDHAAAAPPRTVLLAADHRELEPSSYALLRTLALKHRARVLVTHITVGADVVDPLWSQRQYQHALKDVEMDLLEGHGTDVVNGLSRMAHRKGADMIAMVHRDVGFFSRLFNPSTAKEMALDSELPLLVLQDRAS